MTRPLPGVNSVFWRNLVIGMQWMPEPRSASASIGVPVGVLAILVLIQFPANESGKAAEDGASVSAAAICVGDQDGVPCS